MTEQKQVVKNSPKLKLDDKNMHVAVFENTRTNKAGDEFKVCTTVIQKSWRDAHGEWHQMKLMVSDKELKKLLGLLIQLR